MLNSMNVTVLTENAPRFLKGYFYYFTFLILIINRLYILLLSNNCNRSRHKSNYF